MTSRATATNILWTMEVIAEDLALRYLLELSTDIRVAFLVDERGTVTASAPEPPPQSIATAGTELVREARALAAEQHERSVELDVTVEGGAAFVVCDQGPALVCVTGPFALPGLILHDMRVALGDLRRGEAAAPDRGAP